MRALMSLFTRQKKAPTRVCVTCHSLSDGVTVSSDGGCSLALLGLLVLVVAGLLFGLIGYLAGILLIVAGAAVGAIKGRPKLTCPMCGSSEIIPLGTPRANVIVSQLK